MAAALCTLGQRMAIALGRMAEPVICNCLLTNLRFRYLSRRAYPSAKI